MLKDEKDSSKNCNTYNQNPIEKYNGEVDLISEDGKKLPCKFEAGQMEDGLVFIICDCSIYDLSRKEFFPNSDFENRSSLIIKNRIGWDFYATRGKIFLQFKNFEGLVDDGSDELKINGKIGGYFSIYHDTFRDNTLQVKFAYHVKEFSLNTSVEENLQFVTFGVTNFNFDGVESQRNAFSLNIRGVKKIIIKKKRVPDDALHFWEKFKGIRVTCEIIVVIEKETQIEEVKDLVNDLCDLMSIAWGTRVQWIYCFGYNNEGKIVSRNHRSSITRLYQPMQLINKDSMSLKKFLEISYEVFTEKQNFLKQNRYIIDKYLEAKAQNDLLEQRGIKLAGVIESLKELAIKYNLPTSETIIRKDCFEEQKSAIKDALSKAIENSVNLQYAAESEERRIKIIQTNKEEMFAKIHDLNRISIKQMLLAFCNHINLQVSEKDLQKIVNSRNKLIHNGKFICQTYEDKSKLAQKYPNFKDPWSEYSYSMNFVDKCILKMLGYKGSYINQINFEDEELL